MAESCVSKQHIRAIKLSDHSNPDTFFIMLKWIQYVNDSQKMPPYFELLEFLDVQAWHFESLSSKRKPQMTTHRACLETINCEESCVECTRGENHPLGTFSNFQGMQHEEQWDVIKQVLHKSNVQKSSKYRHTLLHIEEDAKTDKEAQQVDDPCSIFETRRRSAIDDMLSEGDHS